MFNLIKNELIKINKQTAYKVLVIIVLAVALLAPVGSFLLNKLINSTAMAYDTVEKQYERFVEEAEIHQSILEQNKQQGNYLSHADIQYRSAIASAEAYKFFIDNGLADSWKAEFRYELAEKNTSYILHKAILDGEIKAEHFENSWFLRSLFDNYNELESDYYGENPTENPKESGSNGFVVYSDKFDKYLLDLIQSDEYDFAAETAAKRAALEARRSEILTLSSKDYLIGELKGYENSVKTAKDDVISAEKTLADQKAAKEKSPESRDAAYAVVSAEHMLKSAKDRVLAAERALATFQIIYDKNLDMVKDWEYNAFRNAYPGMLGDAYLTIESEEYFDGKAKSPWESQSYKEYLDGAESSKKTGAEAAEIFEYAVEKGIDLPQFTDSSKESVRSNIKFTLGIIATVMIIVAGMIMATEHTSGTIRLLMIRPKKRHKILSSKLLALLIFNITLIIISSLITAAVTVLFNGVGDLFVSDLIYQGGKVLRVNSFLTTLQLCAYLFISSTIFASLAFLFSVLTKRTALSIALPLIINTFTSTVQVIMIGLNAFSHFPLLKYTIIPYFDLTAMMTSPVSLYSFSMMNSLMGGEFGSMLYVAIGGYNHLFGVVSVSLYSAVFILISYLTFNKQQITS